MKIAIYAPSWPPGSQANGIVTYASHLVPALRQSGHEVFVLTFDKTSEDDEFYAIDLREAIPARNLRNRLRRRIAPEYAPSFAIASTIRELVERHGVEVFEIEESFGWSFAASRLDLLPVVVRLHGPWCLYGEFHDQNRVLGNRARQWREGRGIKHAHFVTANCNHTLDAVRTYYGLNLSRSRIIPTPLNAALETETWNIATCNKDALLFVGRFDRLKGGDLVLRAFAKLAAANPRLRLTFVGPDRGIDDAKGNKRFFDDFVKENFPDWLRARIDFRGKINHEDVMSLRTKHFATIIAAQIDTMGYMVLEAMALGCPLVTTAVGGIPEFVRDRWNGLVIPSQDVETMFSACQMLLDNHALARQIGKQAWRDCRDLYSSRDVAKQTAAVYEEALYAFERGKQSASLSD